MAFSRTFSPTACWLSLPLLVLAACTGIAPAPNQVSIDDLPERVLDEAQLAECDRRVDEAIDAVVRRRYAAAREAADAALALNPRTARARAVRGMVMLQQAGQSDPIEWSGLRGGEAEMQRALLLAPEDAFVGWMHAVFLAESGHMSAAAEAAEEALARTADAPASERAALLGIAGTYRYELGEERAARPHLEAYVLLRPDDAAAHFRLGVSLLRIAAVPQGEWTNTKLRLYAEQAAREFRSSWDLVPGDDDAALAIAAALVRAGELADAAGNDEIAAQRRLAAVEHLRTLTKAFPENAEVQFRLGVLAAAADDPAAARAAYTAALNLDGEHAGSLMNLAGLLIEAGDSEAGAGLLRRLLAVDGEQSGVTPEERKAVEKWLANLASGS